MNEIVIKSDEIEERIINFPVSGIESLKLNSRQIETAERYLVHYDLNRAIHEIYNYGGPIEKGLYTQATYSLAHKLRSNEHFLTYIAARMNETAMPADRVLRELARIASSSIEDFLNDEMLEIGKPFFDLNKARRLGVLGCIKRIVFLDKGGVQVELYDKLRALEDLARHFNLLRDNEVQIDNYVITVVRTGDDKRTDR